MKRKMDKNGHIGEVAHHHKEHYGSASEMWKEFPYVVTIPLLRIYPKQLKMKFYGA